LAEYVLDQHKPAIFVVNKWDLLRPMATGTFGEYIRRIFPNLDFVPIAFITAKNGRNVYATLNLAQNLAKQAGRRIATGDLNRIVEEALAESPPPLRQNRRPKIFYATQVAVNPPTIVLMTNGPELLGPTYRRYLLKTFRDRLPFKDIPIKLHVRQRSRTKKRPLLASEKDGRSRTSARRKRQKSEVWKDV
jgi:GTP-binding protein